MDTEDLRLRIYDTFRRTGRAPSKAELAVEFNASEDEVVAGLRALHADRHIVLDRNGESESILFAYPFSSAPMGFSVMGKNTLWWGGCAWDSFVLANLLPEEGEMLIATRCLACNTPHAWNVGAEVPPEGEQVAHFLTPVSRMWEDVANTCRNQRIFCSRDCVRAWLASTGNTEGYTMDLRTLWKLASRWYEGRLERGYVRRSPVEAKAYFRECGLSGPFWGL